MAHGAVEARGAHVHTWHPRGHLIETSCCQALLDFALNAFVRLEREQEMACEGHGDRVF